MGGTSMPLFWVHPKLQPHKGAWSSKTYTKHVAPWLRCLNYKEKLEVDLRYCSFSSVSHFRSKHSKCFCYHPIRFVFIVVYMLLFSSSANHDRGTFDIVLSGRMSDDAGFLHSDEILAEILKILKPNGVFYLSEPKGTRIKSCYTLFIECGCIMGGREGTGS